MQRSIAMSALLVVLATVTGCSTTRSGSGATTTDPSGTITTPVTAAVDPATSAGATTSVGNTAAPSTPAPTTPAITPAPTPAPTTVPCRVVGDLFGSDPSTVSVRRGDCGEGVREIQTQLNAKLGTTLNVDGRFGPGTEAAVKQFQTSVGLAADGIVGPQTWVALNDDGT